MLVCSSYCIPPISWGSEHPQAPNRPLFQDTARTLPNSARSLQSRSLRKASRDVQALQASQVSQNGVASEWPSLGQAPSWARDQAPPDWGSGFNPPQQLFHRSKSVPLIPNRLRVFAGTSNSVRLSPSHNLYIHPEHDHRGLDNQISSY